MGDQRNAGEGEPAGVEPFEGGGDTTGAGPDNSPIVFEMGSSDGPSQESPEKKSDGPNRTAPFLWMAGIAAAVVTVIALHGPGQSGERADSHLTVVDGGYH